MSRGLSEDEAVGMIIRGFLVGGIKGLPQELTDEINAAIEQSDLGH
jgi:Fe-S cluster assembly scaffold protein SufB